MVLPVLNCASSIYAGFVIFSVLGYMAKQAGVDIQDIAGSGTYRARFGLPFTILCIYHVFCVSYPLFTAYYILLLYIILFQRNTHVTHLLYFLPHSTYLKHLTVPI